MPKYFAAKIQYSEPVPGTDKIKKHKKKFIVRAESVTEVELKCQQWFVANWQDPEVKEVTNTPIQEIIETGESGKWFQFKVMYEDLDTGKWSSEVVAANGGDIKIALARVEAQHHGGVIDEGKKIKIEFDSDLYAEAQ